MPVGAKLRVPLPRRTVLHRARLGNPFGVDGALPRLVLLAAPPGFGKTTLLTQWLTEPLGDVPAGEPPRVAWVSLDESDAEVSQFLSDLVDALAPLASGLAAEARALLDRDRPAPAEDVLVSVVNDLDALDGTTVIALDDLHRAGGPAVHDAVAFLLENLPPRVVVAITTRADPPLPLARLRARGELVEVRAADLRLTPEESDGFLRAVMNLALAPDQVDALTARTEGWIAGLQLAALSARSRTPSGAEAVDDFVRTFAGSHRFVLDYLVEEVLDAQPADVCEFLLLTSVLDRLSGPLCDAVTGGAGGQQQLAQLETANVFLTALDDDRTWFRYHQLFAEAVRSRLAAERPDAVRALHLAAARWYAGQGLLDDALAHALAAGDPAVLADLVECSLPDLRQRRRDRALLRWIGEVPDAVVRERAILATTRAWAKLAGGDPQAATEWLALAEDRLAGADGPVGLLVEVPDDVAAARGDEWRTMGAHIAIYRAALAQAAGDVAETVHQAQTARARSAPTDHFAHGAAAGFLGLAAWADGDLATAVDTFTEAVEHLAAAGNATDQLGATVVLAEMALARSGPADARRLYEQALVAAGQNPAAATAIAADLHVGLAGVLREQDDLDAAARELATATELGEAASLQENRFRSHTVRAALLRASGDIDAALRELDAAEARYLPGFFPATRPLAAVRARLLIGAGQLREARQWAVQHAVGRADPAAYLNEYDLLTWARLLVAEHRRGLAEPGEWDALPGLLATIADGAASRRGSLVDVRTVEALMWDARGETGRAQDALAQALVEGVPAGFRRVFLDEGEPMTDLLRGHAGAGLATSALARGLLDRTAVAVPLRLAVPGAEELSERELEVLRLLASDLSGPEIASRLFVSINTLRTHTKHIFTKLDVRTRRAAVTRARERNLL